MKSKFLGIIVTLAVCLGLVLVPAMVAADPGTDCWLEVDPAVTKVGFNEPFDVNVTMENPTEQDLAVIMCHINFTASLVEVTGVDCGAAVGSPFTQPAAGPTWNNTEGWLDYDASTPAGTTTNVTSVVYATIHMMSKVDSGIAAIEFVPVDAWGDAETAIIDTSAADHTDWALVVNGTVKTGAPTLTVDVDGSGTVTINNAITPTVYPNNSSWSWDDVVPLQANAAAGWEWSSWTGTNDNGVNPTDVTMDVDKSVTANFVEKPAILDVDTTPLSFIARYGDNTDSKTVEIANVGGHVLDWAVGSPPTWEAGNYWAYYTFYEPFPGYNATLPGYFEGMVTMAVTGGGSGSDYACSVTIDPAQQRTIMGGMPAVLWNATALVDEYTLDMVQQLGFMSIWPYGPSGAEVPVLANLTWAYDSAHGWPYYPSKTWTYNLTMDVNTYPGGSPIDYKVIPVMAMVTAYNSTLGAWEITHMALPSMTPFMQTWWSPTAQNFVQQADGGTYDYPPMDVRSLVDMFTAAPAGAPDWLSFAPMHGALGIGGSELLNVTASSSGLDVGIHTGSFTISAPGSIQEETVDVSIEVTPATTIDVIRNLPADALDLDAEYPGMTFDVWVNFTASVDDFATVGLTDLAPAGWDVETDISWCSPAASWTMSPGNKAEYSWSGPFAKDTVFSAMYTVTIPATALNGLNEWPNNDGTKAWAEYWFGAVGPFTSNVTGEYQKIVTVPGKVVGETRDVNADLLTTTLVVCSEEPPEALDEPEDSDSSTAPDALYKVDVDDTGQYWLEASKYCYFDLLTKPEAEGGSMPGTRNPWHADFIDFGDTAKLYAGYNLDFEGDYGLVPKACTMSYAMKSVNHWLFVPVDGSLVQYPEWQLSNWKAMESVHSWQFPCGCNT